MYENITYKEILKKMLDRIPNTLDKREGSVIYDALAPAAMELKQAFIELDSFLDESFADTASRPFLVRRCAERGIIPHKATKAVLYADFNPIDIDVIGKRFSVGTLTYVVIEKIEHWEEHEHPIWKVQCETPGAVGNDNTYCTLLPIDYVPDLQSANMFNTVIKGEDEESTDHLRERYFSSFKEHAFGGNKADYIAKVSAIEGVGAVKVKRVWNGNIHPADMIPNETVQTWYDDNVDSFSADVKAWLQAVYTAALNKMLTVGGTVEITVIDGDDYTAASAELIALVQNTIDPTDGEGDGLAPIGHVVVVDTADEIDVDVAADITYDTGYSWQTLKTSIVNCLNEYLLELRQMWEDTNSLVVRTSEINSRLLAIEGIIDVQNITINEESSNLTLTENEIPILHSVSDGENTWESGGDSDE